MSETMYEIHCPVCGKCLGKSAEGTSTEVTCPKCKSDLAYTVHGGAVTVSIEKRSTKRPA